MTYDYECPDCGLDFEIEQKITDDPLTMCPNDSCKGKDLKKVISQNTTGWKLVDGERSGWARNGY